MGRMKEVIYLLVIIVLLIILLCGGCSGTGFEKKTTLMPGSVGISYMQERFQGDDDAWKGVSITGTWEFK